MSLFSCQATIRLASEALDHNLKLTPRLALGAHLLMCPPCARLHRQLRFLRDAARRLDAGAPAGLSPEARRRIQRAIEQHQS